jgi:long-chain acyl-CoA synthetase
MFLKDHKKAALISRGAEIPYAEVIASANDYAALYQLKPGERIAVFAENRAEWIYAYFSAWHKGGVNVPIDHMSSADEVAHILHDCRPVAVFCSAATRPVLAEALANLDPAYKPRIFDFEQLGAPPRMALAPEVPRAKTDTAVIIYTSGTTGSPKGVML